MIYVMFRVNNNVGDLYKIVVKEELGFEFYFFENIFVICYEDIFFLVYLNSGFV